MPKLPWDKFCYVDFERDTSVLSNEATGIWIRLLCRTWASPRRGYLLHATGKPFTDDDAANMLRVSVERWREVKDELLRTGVASSGKGGVLYNRRQVRDEQQRSGERLRKGESRQESLKSLAHQQQRPEVVRPSVREVSGNFPAENQNQNQNQNTAAIAAVVPAAAPPPRPEPPRTPELTREEWDQPDPTAEAYNLVNRLMKIHPKPGNAQLAQAAAARVLAGAVNMRGLLADIEAKHEAWREYWARKPKSFRPMLHRWFQDGDYMNAPVTQQEKGEFEW